MQISNTVSLDTELVLTERRATSEFRITEVHESIVSRFVRVEIEMGPFVSYEDPNGTTRLEGAGGRRSLIVWDNETYDAIRDTWTNTDLLSVVKDRLSS